MLRATTSTQRQAAAKPVAPTPATPLPRDRATAALAAALVLSTTAAAPAANASPLADFWRSRQSANGGIKLLAPLRTSQMRLEEATRLFAAAPPAAAADAPALVADASPDAPTIEALASSSPDPTTDDLVRALALVRASSLNCYAYDSAAADSLEAKASLFQQSLKGVDPCTWRIVLRNITTLEPAEKRAEGMAMADELVRSYQLLDALLGEAADGRPGALDRARLQADQTLRIERGIEGFVRGVLKV